jgi:biotin carboxylase
MDYNNKRLLILGGNPETRVLVEIANNLGIYTIVVDPNPLSPAKKVAKESYEYDGFDIDQIVLLAKDKNVDGVLVGVADILVAPYQVICEKLKLPCYATNEIIEAFCSKDGFKKACEKYNIRDIPGFYVNDTFDIHKITHLKFPLMVKPVDNGAGVGMGVCHNLTELNQTINNAFKFSKKGGVLVEQYMNCDDMFAYYTFENGKAYLSALADRITTKKQGNLSPVCLGAIYPSKYSNYFIKNINPLMISFFQKLGITNGILNIQFFVRDNQYYAYDPGFRLQGEAPHIHILEYNKFDHREMLINFALTGNIGISNFNEKNDYLFKNGYAATIWVLLKSGTITNIIGLDIIKSDVNVSFVMQRFFENEIIEPDMIGTERQVFARIYLQCKEFEIMKEKIVQFKKILIIEDNNGNNMIVDWVSPTSILNYKSN